MDKLKTKLDDVTKEERARARELWGQGKNVFQIARELGLAIHVTDRIVKTGGSRQVDHELAQYAAEEALKARLQANAERRAQIMTSAQRELYEGEMRYIELTERLIGLVMPDGGTPDEALERVAALVEAAKSGAKLVRWTFRTRGGTRVDANAALWDELCAKLEAAGFEV